MLRNYIKKQTIPTGLHLHPELRLSNSILDPNPSWSPRSAATAKPTDETSFSLQ